MRPIWPCLRTGLSLFPFQGCIWILVGTEVSQRRTWGFPRGLSLTWGQLRSGGSSHFWTVPRRHTLITPFLSQERCLWLTRSKMFLSFAEIRYSSNVPETSGKSALSQRPNFAFSRHPKYINLAGMAWLVLGTDCQWLKPTMWSHEIHDNILLKEPRVEKGREEEGGEETDSTTCISHSHCTQRHLALHIHVESIQFFPIATKHCHFGLFSHRCSDGVQSQMYDMMEIYLDGFDMVLSGWLDLFKSRFWRDNHDRLQSQVPCICMYRWICKC